MGCDGGTIPKRDELVKLKKKPEQKDKASELSFRWQHCAISQEPLKKPIVACGLGRLYNKDAVIQKLLDKSEVESVSHIKNLKDVKDLNLTSNPAFKDELAKGDNHPDQQMSPYICPISGLEMNGKFKFCFLWTCGCVISERALKQFNDKICVCCQIPFTENDVIILNATDEDLFLMNSRKEKRLNLIKANKKQKSKKCDRVSEDEVNIKQDKVTKGDIVSKKETSKSSSSSKILKQQKNEAKISKRPLEGIIDPAYKKAKASYSVSKDGEASEVFKSLFTSHKDAQSHSKAHWITYNPFYN